MRTSATLLLVFVAGCGLIGGKKEDAGTEATPGAIDAAAVVAEPGAPIGKNVAAVARFQSETAMNEPKVIGQVSTPRTSPGGGTIVATLKPQTVVTRIAMNGTASLIVFPDPNVPTDMLMGWVTEAAFSSVVLPKVDAGVKVVDAGVAVVDAGPPAPVVVDAGPAWVATKCSKANTIAVKLGATTAWACRPICASNAQCLKGKKTCEQADVYNPEPGKATTAKVCHDDN